MNKSRVARDLWRKVFSDNLIDLRNSDQRKQVVSEFLNDPANSKAGWKKKDSRFFRLAFSKVARENNFQPMSVGVTPTPSRSKTKKGSMSFNVKSKEKAPPPPSIPAEGLNSADATKNAQKLPIPNTAQINAQIPQASYYSAQSIGQIFETFFNIFSTKLGCSPLSQNERIAMGEAWTPVFNQYFSGENIFIMPALVSLPIILQRVAEVSKIRKEKELKEKYTHEDDANIDADYTKHRDAVKSNKWKGRSFDGTTDQR